MPKSTKKGGALSVSEAGRKGGQRVKQLINAGKAQETRKSK